MSWGAVGLLLVGYLAGAASIMIAVLTSVNPSDEHPWVDLDRASSEDVDAEIS